MRSASAPHAAGELRRGGAAAVRTLAFAYRNALFARRNVFMVVEMIFWPVLGVFSIGLMGEYLRFEPPAFEFVMVGAIAAGVLQVAQLDVAYGMMYDVWSKSLKHTLLSPAVTIEFVAGSWLVGILRGSFVFALLAGSARLFFGFALPGPGRTAAFLGGLFLCAAVLGVLVMVLILGFGQRAEIATWMFAPLGMLLCGFYYPVEALPGGLALAAKAVPLTYALEIMREGYGFTATSGAFWRMFALCAGYGALALWGLRRSLERARRTGMIVRLSE